MKKGVDIFVEGLLREGVEIIFGYPGGVLIPIYDRLYDAPIKHVLPRHEQAGAHAADGYARASGKVGVCMATSGPGATNLVTGIATAYMDSSPIVAFTGQVATALIGGDAFQEADITGITRPITKHNYLVQDVDELPKIIAEAFYIARTGRPGPVLVDLPKDISLGQTENDFPEQIDIPGYKPTIIGNKKQIKLAAEQIKKAKRPVIYIGGGVIISNAHEEVKELAEKYNIPVTSTLMGLGGFPGDHRLFMGMIGMHGTAAANLAVHHCDLLIAIGARFDDRVTGRTETFSPHSKIIHIDIDPASIYKIIKVDIPIVGDAKNILEELLHILEESKCELNTIEWLNQIEKWKKENPLTYKKQKGKIKPQFVVEEIYRLTKGNAIITTEVGQNQMWAAQFYKFTKPRQFISSGGLGTMGFGLPAAIGAQFARPGELVIDIAGDGSIQMNIQELTTLKAHNLPVKIIVLNNNYLGMVRQWQQLFFNKRYSQTDLHTNPDFGKVAEAFGIKGVTIKEEEEVRDALNYTLNYEGPILLNILVDEEENVFPMVPAGASNIDMIRGDN
ncbi:MAG TPA: biosynthetic-type acetolactate synthase large subunit [bacterium]|nr:biosynthetic-type acetolactate synthase large subunit [bacterium]HOL48702.1 biosynthetic-type acetolactate synthase large subunit [bacterium]HPQ19817.1 biosynthetic-type acetolactate synthase large subunit [bacterium]